MTFEQQFALLDRLLAVNSKSYRGVAVRAVAARHERTWRNLWIHGVGVPSEEEATRASVAHEYEDALVLADALAPDAFRDLVAAAQNDHTVELCGHRVHFGDAQTHLGTIPRPDAEHPTVFGWPAYRLWFAFGRPPWVPHLRLMCVGHPYFSNGTDAVWRWCQPDVQFHGALDGRMGAIQVTLPQCRGRFNHVMQDGSNLAITVAGEAAAVAACVIKGKVIALCSTSDVEEMTLTTDAPITIALPTDVIGLDLHLIDPDLGVLDSHIEDSHQTPPRDRALRPSVPGEASDEAAVRACLEMGKAHR